MKEKYSYTSWQIAMMVLLRFLIGWHLLYEGFSKVMTPNWTSFSFLKESKWILEGFAGWITSHAGALAVVDFLNTWGLIAIGLGLILGLFARIAAFSGAILLFIYYLNNPPLVGLEYNLPSEGSYLIISKTLIEVASLLVIAVFPTSGVLGLDRFILLRKNDKKVKNQTEA